MVNTPCAATAAYIVGQTVAVRHTSIVGVITEATAARYVVKFVV